eukprot:scaffold17271_cov69-Cyclotella_meneghiniana.AAC.13
MKVFGLGTLSSMSSKERYARFTHSMYGVYGAMEDELDLSSGITKYNLENGGSRASEPVQYFWTLHSEVLRRSNKLKQDLIDIGKDAESMDYSTATIKYRNAIRAAGSHDRECGGGLLLGHAYTRYLADLMGGQVLATPTRLALGLNSDSPKQYSFDLNYVVNGGMIRLTRKEYVEKIYQDLNVSGDILTENIKDRQLGRDTVLEDIVKEARSAFQHNVEVYSEEPIWMDSLLGLKNIIGGWVFQTQSS